MLSPSDQDMRAYSTLRRLFRRSSASTPRRHAVLLGRLRILLALPFILIILLVSAWWLGAMNLALVGRGETFQLKSLVLRMSRGTELDLGRAELLQPPGRSSAEPSHIRLIHTREGDLRIGNIAEDRRLFLFREGAAAGGFSADQIALNGRKGQVTRLLVEGRDIRFSNPGPDGFDIDIPGNGRFRATINIARKATWLSSGLGWDRASWIDLRSIGPDGTLGETVEDCAGGAWREAVQRVFQPLAIWWGRHADIPVLYLGGERSCRTRNAFQLALPQPEGIDELVVSFASDGRRLFLAPVSRRKRNIIVVERFREGCGFTQDCRIAPPQTGLVGTTWRVAQKEKGETGSDSSEPRVWRFVAGRTTYNLDARPTPQGDLSVVITPLGNVPQFSAAACRAKSVAAPNAPQDDSQPCPESARQAPSGTSIAVNPGDPARLFDRAFQAQALEPAEIWGHRLVLAASLVMAIFLAGPATGSARSRSRIVSGLIRLMRIWPVIVSVTLASLPELLSLVGVSLGAFPSFAVTIANWAFVGTVLALVPRTGRQLALMWVVLTGLAAIGSISLATFAGDIGTTRAALYLIKHKFAFLDLLPPVALAVVTARLEVLRPVLASLVLDNRARYALVRLLPPMAMIALFLLWLAVGTQQGLGSFQPVEGGKFWFVVMVGAVLVSFERGSRAVALGSSRSSQAWGAIAAIAFLLALYLVPFLRSDYSPLLIITATSLVLVLLRFLPDLWRWIVARFRALSERMHLPMRLRPIVQERLVPLFAFKVRRGTAFVAGLGLILAGFLGAAFVMLVFGGNLLAFALQLDPREWPKSTQQQTEVLEHSLGIGRRVPIERILTWIDLRYPEDKTLEGEAERPHVRYRDIGFQVVRSRVEIENASCGLSPEMRGMADFPVFGTWPSWALTQTAETAAALFGIGLDANSPLCVKREAPDNPDAPTANTILDPRGAHTIPVAENDFAAGYLIARHGVAAAALLFSFQFAFVLLAVIAYIRLARLKGGDTSDQIVRYLLSILLVGTATLFVLQWFLAWSNSLGLVPVMGQPMTWLAAGTSHHLLMALPCSVTILLAMRYMVKAPKRRPLRAPPL